MSIPTPGIDPNQSPDAARNIDALRAKLEEAVDVMQESKDSDGARWAKADAERVELGTQIQTMVDKQQAEERTKATEQAVADMNDFLSSVRSPSKAAAIGGNTISDGIDPDAPNFLMNVFLARSSDHEEQTIGKAGLAKMGLRMESPWGEGVLQGSSMGNASMSGEAHGGYALKGKATLGTSAATGQAIIPNALVDTLAKPATYEHPFRSLLTVISGVTAAKVQVPVRGAAAARAVIAPPGETKENRDLGYLAYTATMYTLALIYDISKQFLRQSQGAAEADVMGELANAFALGEAYYVLNGAGTTEPYGVLTALTAMTTDYTTSHTAAAATIAGNTASAIAKAAGALATRNRMPTGVVVNAADYWASMTYGADAAGFYVNPTGGAVGTDPSFPFGGPGLRVWGIPVFPDSTMPTDRMVIGDWKQGKLYLGDSYRVDSSDVAGDRWDKNLVGFRGEMEMGFDARPAVMAGAFQDVTNFIA